MAKDGKNVLPSVDGPSTQPPTGQFAETKKQVEQKIMESHGVPSEIMGYVPRQIDVRMSRSQAERFKAIQRSLEDSGATLKDGTPVTNRRRAVLWMIENHKDL